MDVSLVLTHDCNLGCGYCYTGAKFRKRMPREIADKALDLAFNDPAPEVQLSYFGGEPTLELDMLLAVAHEANTRGKRLGNNADFNRRAEVLERRQARGHQHGIADGAQAYEQHASNDGPIQKSLRVLSLSGGNDLVRLCALQSPPHRRA